MNLKINGKIECVDNIKTIAENDIISWSAKSDSNPLYNKVNLTYN